MKKLSTPEEIKEHIDNLLRKKEKQGRYKKISSDEDRKYNLILDRKKLDKDWDKYFNEAKNGKINFIVLSVIMQLYNEIDIQIYDIKEIGVLNDEKINDERQEKNQESNA